MPMPKRGNKYLMRAGERMSTSYPGYVRMESGVYKKPYIRTDKRGTDRAANHYFVETECAHCGRKSLTYRSNKRKAQRSFCSTKCQYQSRISADGARKLKRGTGTDSHVMVKAASHPGRDRNGFVPEHRLVVEGQIGRHLRQGEIVHHINLIKGDNRAENLFLCGNASEHFLIHGSLNKCVAELMAMGALVFDGDAKEYRVNPTLDLSPGRLRVPHDGIADAMCLAEYGRVTL